MKQVAIIETKFRSNQQVFMGRFMKFKYCVGRYKANSSHEYKLKIQLNTKIQLTQMEHMTMGVPSNLI